MRTRGGALATLLVGSVLAGAACGDSGGGAPADGGGSGGGGASGAGAVTDPGDPQTPPLGEANARAWLAAGHYKSWSCESSAHPPRPPSTHGRVRICSNDLVSAHGAGEYPVGAAAVAELYENVQNTLIGHALSRHVDAGAEGQAWYFFMDQGDVFFGDGVGLGACASCHARAGMAPDTGHDFVFTQVR